MCRLHRGLVLVAAYCCHQFHSSPREIAEVSDIHAYAECCQRHRIPVRHAVELCILERTRLIRCILPL